MQIINYSKVHAQMVHVHAQMPRLLPKEILKEPFGLLTSKIRSPSHFSKLWKFRGGAWGQPLSLSAEIFHETRIWSNTKNPSISTQGAYFKFRRRQGARIRGGGGGGGVLNRGGLFNFSQIMTWYDHFFNTSSVQKQHKLLIVIKKPDPKLL